MTRLLVIEDDPQLSQVLKISLERQGYRVNLVTDGLRGYEEALAQSYDGVVLDWTLPHMSGIEICKKLRAAGLQMPLIMLTGRSASRDKIAGLDTGADDFLTKPFSADELHARIRALLRRKTEDVSAVLRIADLELNAASHIVTRGGVQIDLMPKEYELLLHFMQHPGVALSRESILKGVWNVDAKNSSNRLDVYIKHLRSKIDDNHDHKLLHTVRGVGYRLSS